MFLKEVVECMSFSSGPSNENVLSSIVLLAFLYEKNHRCWMISGRGQCQQDDAWWWHRLLSVANCFSMTISEYECKLLW